MKTKRIHFFASSIALLLTAFVFFSCSQSNSAGTVTLSTTIPTSSFDKTGTEAVETAYTLEVSISGEYSETQSQEVSETENSKTFEFQEIPVGAEIKLSAKLLSGDETICSGESGLFTVKAGENLIKLSMKKAQSEETEETEETEKTDETEEAEKTDETETTEETEETEETVWIVLWNRSTTEENDSGSDTTNLTKGMSSFTEDSLSSAEITADNRLTSKTIDSFAFSDDGDLYTLEENQDNYYIKQYKKNSTGYTIYTSNNTLLKSVNASDYSLEEITCHGDYVYVMWTFYSSETECNMTQIGGIKLSDLETATSFDTTTTIQNFYATHIAFTDDTMFATTSNEVYSFDYTEGIDNNFENATYDPIATLDSGSITDLHVQDGYLYGLLAYSSMDSTTKGGVFKIDTSKKELSNWTTSGRTLLGWNDTESDTPHGSSDYLFYPTNFIATSPKKLVISDDGCREPTDDNDTDPNNENRVVTIDLETEAMTATDVNVMFDNEKTGCGLTKA